MTFLDVLDILSAKCILHVNINLFLCVNLTRQNVIQDFSTSNKQKIFVNTWHKYTISNLGTCTHLAQFYYTI